MCHLFISQVFVMDDEVIISGGNLSTEYFVDRQDRYVFFKSAGLLVMQLFRAIVLFKSLCSPFLSIGSLASFYRNLILKLAGCGQVISGEANDSSWVEVCDMIEPLSCQIKTEVDSSEIDDVVDTWVYPTLQCAPHGVHQDEDIFMKLLNLSQSLNIGSVNLATAYLNPDLKVIEALASSAPNGSLKIITAHADSHGFKTARGVMSLIPLCYQHLLCDYIKPLITKLRRENGVSSFCLLAYQREFWTFHTKGFWVSECESGEVDIKSMVSIVGSSNYGKRSNSLDLESQVVVLTENKRLMREFQGEWNRLESHTSPVGTHSGLSPIQKIKAVLTSLVMSRYL
jgi:CDP-diacylglycerol---glycerol-3-phosphate 3-phosphatidyltransferase